jgi:hypothetical protein
MTSSASRTRTDAAEAVDLPYGKGLLAARDLAAGERVAVFEGPILRFADIPAEELRHVLWLDGDRWMIPRPPARWINHGCEPNCRVLDRPDDPARFDIVTLRQVWTFECRCGAPTCRGLIDGYELDG